MREIPLSRLWPPEILEVRNQQSLLDGQESRSGFCPRSSATGYSITEMPGASFHVVLLATHQIRHMAVHRRLASIRDIFRQCARERQLDDY